MLGIDIVNLSDPQIKSRDERALRLIQHSEDLTIDHPHLYWLLWSAKEAVFKCLREANNFSPTSIPIELKWSNEEVQFTSGVFQGKFEISAQYLLAVCSDKLDSIDHEVIEMEKVISGSEIRIQIQKYFKQKNYEFEIGADDLNLPILLPSNEPISVSHHGNLGAFAYPTSLTH